MSTLKRVAFHSGAALAAWLFLNSAAFAQDQGNLNDDPNRTFVTIVVALIFVLTVLTLVWFLNAMASAKPAWSLADALSEEVTLTPEDANGPRFDVNNKALMATEMKASSSRLIAFLGAIVILFMFLGFGTFVLYRFGTTGVMPTDVGKILAFLSGGLALFAPYAVNKLSSIGSP